MADGIFVGYDRDSDPVWQIGDRYFAADSAAEVLLLLALNPDAGQSFEQYLTLYGPITKERTNG